MGYITKYRLPRNLSVKSSCCPFSNAYVVTRIDALYLAVKGVLNTTRHSWTCGFVDSESAGQLIKILGSLNINRAMSGTVALPNAIPGMCMLASISRARTCVAYFVAISSRGPDWEETVLFCGFVHGMRISVYCSCRRCGGGGGD